MAPACSVRGRRALNGITLAISGGTLPALPLVNEQIFYRISLAESLGLNQNTCVDYQANKSRNVRRD